MSIGDGPWFTTKHVIRARLSPSSYPRPSEKGDGRWRGSDWALPLLIQPDFRKLALLGAVAPRVEKWVHLSPSREATGSSGAEQ